MNNETLTTLTRQFETAWKLTEYHLEGLGDAECLWRPADKGLHVCGVTPLKRGVAET
jgi:hypothetical protein